jgi:hypothetical protein
MDGGTEKDRKNGRWAGQQDKEPAAAAIPAGYSAHGQRTTCSDPLRRSQSEREQAQRPIWGHRARREGKGRGREKLRTAAHLKREAQREGPAKGRGGATAYTCKLEAQREEHPWYPLAYGITLPRLTRA